MQRLYTSMIQGIIQSEVKYLENDAIFLNHHTLTYHLSHTFDTLDKICNQSHNVQLHILKNITKKKQHPKKYQVFPSYLKIPMKGLVLISLLLLRLLEQNFFQQREFMYGFFKEVHYTVK